MSNLDRIGCLLNVSTLKLIVINLKKVRPIRVPSSKLKFLYQLGNEKSFFSSCFVTKYLFLIKDYVILLSKSLL